MAPDRQYPTNGKEWNEYRLLVLNELKNCHKEIEELSKKHDEAVDKLSKEINDLSNEINGLKLKMAGWGGAAGAVGSLIVILASLAGGLL